MMQYLTKLIFYYPRSNLEREYRDSWRFKDVSLDIENRLKWGKRRRKKRFG